MPVIVASALSGMSGKIWVSTAPWPGPVPELVAARLGVSAAVFVSVRGAAGIGEAATGWEASFAGDFAAAVFSEFLVAAEDRKSVV